MKDDREQPGFIEKRLPVGAFMRRHFGEYRVPRHLSVLWSFGAAAVLFLLILMGSGLVMALHLRPDMAKAFDSMQAMVRDVPYGWLMRALHQHGASFLFMAITIHSLRGIYYGSFKPPREIVWIIGVLMGLVLMACAFTGAVLSWSQTGYWSAMVVTDLASVLPGGETVVQWLRGGDTLATPTLQRFFVLHLLLPFLLLGLLALHIWAVHVAGSNNPTGVDPKSTADTVPFFPDHLRHVSRHLGALLLLYAACVFFWPESWGDPNAFRPADPAHTPDRIAPAWYLRPYFAMLRAVPDKVLGAWVLLAGIMLPLALPWLDRHPVRSGRYRPWFRVCFALYVGAWLALIWAGGQQAQGAALMIARMGTAYALGFFLIALPLLSRFEKAIPAPGKKKRPTKALFLLLVGFAVCQTGPAWAESSDTNAPFREGWGAYDQAALQRGWRVYRESCPGCPGLVTVTYRHLADIGYSAGDIRLFARQDADGDINAPLRSAKSVYDAQRAHQAYWDLAVPATAGGSASLFLYLSGQSAGHAGVTGLEGMQSALHGDVHAARDLTTFLLWASDPHRAARQRLGVAVLLFLIIFISILYGCRGES